MTEVQERERWPRSLPFPRQQELAIALASIVEPGARLSAAGQPVGGLSPVAGAIRSANTDVEVDQARHRLFATPELQWDDEPDGAAWFAYRATCAWIYAADSKCTAPGGGLVNAFRCALDFLDALDDLRGGETLSELLMVALGDETSLTELRARVKEAVAEVAVAL